ncbi:MAG: 2-phosphosulfolactate phosphatase [Methylophilus sp.]|uniref:2-phosphosulfolactate phosphatase n=1 Tax=Methylophilus sp. TaxID=29541 RepID=UPI003FA19082
MTKKTIESSFWQQGYDVRLEWGLPAAVYLDQEIDCVVIVDVMSFSTCVSLANDRGAYIYPWPWKDDSATAYAAKIGGHAASIDRKSSPDTFSLSPASIQNLPENDKLVLPSPNGATISFKAKALSGVSIFSACLRNMQATAKACSHFKTVMVIPCGERWPDNSFRPALEDYVAAGGIIAAFQGRHLSPEAKAAVAVYRSESLSHFATLKHCVSARELVARGFSEDVDLCLQADVSDKANQMTNDYYQGINP